MTNFSVLVFWLILFTIAYHLKIGNLGFFSRSIIFYSAIALSSLFVEIFTPLLRGYFAGLYSVVAIGLIVKNIIANRIETYYHIWVLRKYFYSSFVIFFSIIFFKSMGSEYHIWDDFSHWGRIARDIYNFGFWEAVSKTAYSNYFPVPAMLAITPLLFAELFNFPFSEGMSLFSHSIFLLLIVFSVLELCERQNAHIPLGFTLLFLSCFGVVHGFRTLMVDGLLVMMTTYIVLLSWGWKDRRLGHYVFVLTMMLGILVYAKNSGFFFAGLVFLSLVIRPLNTSGVEKLFFIVCVVILGYLYEQYLSSTDLTSVRSHDFVSNFSAQFGRFDRITSEQQVIFLKVIKSFLTPFFYGSSGGVSSIGLSNLMLIATAFWLVLFDQRRSWRLGLLILVSLGAALIALLLHYIFNMSKTEAHDLHSFGRYAGSITVFLWLIVWFSCCLDRKLSFGLSSWCFVGLVLVTDLKGVGYFGHPMIDQGRIDRREFVSNAQTHRASLGILSTEPHKYVYDLGCQSVLSVTMLQFDFPDIDFASTRSCGMLGPELHQFIEEESRKGEVCLFSERKEYESVGLISSYRGIYGYGCD